MIDTIHINLLALIEQDTNLKRVASTGGGEYAGPCPFCGGTDRFRVWPHDDLPHFWCRQCSASGDAIDYVRNIFNLDFKAACDYLKLDLPNRQPLRTPRPILPPRPRDWNALRDPAWQHAAEDFIAMATAEIKRDSAHHARQYLLGRGITDAIIEEAGIGYNPQNKHIRWGKLLVWLSSGIVIPWRIDDQIWRINIRRLITDNRPKYVQPSGCANGLYRADAIMPGSIVVMTEGEFDTLLIAGHTDPQAFQSPVVPVATGSSSGARMLRWIVDINLAAHVLLAFDTDDAGEEAAQWWLDKLGSKASRLHPTQHDVTDMVKAGENLSDWIASAGF